VIRRRRLLGGFRSGRGGDPLALAIARNVEWDEREAGAGDRWRRA